MPPANAAEDNTPLTHRAILAIALPVMISNISTPLIGVVDIVPSRTVRNISGEALTIE